MKNNTDKQKLKDVFLSVDTLKKFLNEKASSHIYFKRYTTIDFIETWIEERAVFLSLNKDWNDINDKNNVNNYKSDCYNYVACFTFSKSENVAMWMLYGGLEKKGAMINYKKSMLPFFDNFKKLVYLGMFEKNKFKCKKSIEISKEDIEVIDVLYLDKHNNIDSDKKYAFKRSDERVERAVFNVDKLNYAVKSYYWNYENECRVIISIKKDLLKDVDMEEIKEMKVSLNNEVDLKDRVYLSPNFENNGHDYSEYKVSKIDGLNWDLCNKCKYKNK